MRLLSHNLQAFVSIVHHQTVHGAASELGITQTGVTQRIRALEAELSTTLFIRSRRGMKLTTEGQALFRYCQATQDLEGEALAQIVGGARKSEVRITICGPTSVMSSRVVSQCLPILKKFENLLFTFQVNDLDSRVEDLRAGSVNLAIVSPTHVAREMDSKMMKPEKYLMVGSPSWKGRRFQEVVKTERLIDFDPTDNTSIQYLKNFNLVEHVRSERHFVNNNESLIGMFCNGYGYGVLTMDVARPYLERGDLIPLNSGAVFENALALAWYPRHQMPEYYQAIISAIK
jgi:DNA-binding transcriptional LysR family regulator